MGYMLETRGLTKRFGRGDQAQDAVADVSLHIASSLQVVLGTVKAHVHNILKKTGTTTRQELTQLFWKG